jgi:hemolysin activation/secretion protein
MYSPIRLDENPLYILLEQRARLFGSHSLTPLCSLFIVHCIFMIIAFPSLVWGQATVPSEGKAGVIEKSLRKSRPQFKPPAEEELPEITIKDSRTLEDPGAGPSFKVKRIEVEGNTLINDEMLVPLVEIGEGMEMTLGILTLYANEVTAFYNSKGYFLTRAYIPEQEVKDGVVILKVLEGKLGKIEITGTERLNNQDFVKRLERVTDEEVIREQTLEQVLLELNDLLGVQVSTVLKPGELPGTSDLVLDVTETRPYQISFDGDNFGSRFTGENRFGFTGTVGNILKLGDQFSVRGVRSNEGQNFISPSYLVPIHSSGTTVIASYTFSEHELGENLTSLSAGGGAQIYSLEVAQPLHRSRTTRLFVRGGVELRKFENEQRGQTTSDDELADIYFSMGGNYSDSYGGRTFFDARTQFGFTEGDPNRPLSSRAQGRGDVTIGTMSLVRYQGAGFLNSYFLIRGFGQIASARVLSPDQLNLGGMGTVRGYPLAEFSGDNGYHFTLEYVLPSPWKPSLRFGKLTLDRTLSLFGFIDHGKVFISDRQPGEADQSISGAGGGVRINIPPLKPVDTAVSFSVLYGVPVFGGPRASDGSAGTLYVSGQITY